MFRLAASFRQILGILILTLAVSNNSFSQENISTARPTLSLGSWVLPEHSLQWEQGAGYLDGFDDWLYDSFFRASLSKSTELRVLIPTLESKAAVLGLKWMAVKPEGNKPGIAFNLDLSSVGQEDDFRVISYRVIIEKALTDNLTGAINFGKLGNGYFGDLTLGLSLGDKFGVIGEFWYHEDWQQAQSGITYLINSETQIDIYGGLLFGASDEGSGLASKYTFGLGFARRFKLNYDRDE